MTDRINIEEKLCSNKTSNLDKYLILLEKVRQNEIDIEKAEEELRNLKKGEEEDDKKIEQIMLAMKELEVSTRFIKDYLDKSLKWAVLILSAVFTLLVALLGIFGTFIINNLKTIISAISKG
jgi:hypothetical protein